jgi:hypothetical protein
VQFILQFVFREPHHSVYILIFCCVSLSSSYVTWLSLKGRICLYDLESTIGFISSPIIVGDRFATTLMFSIVTVDTIPSELPLQ